MGFIVDVMAKAVEGIAKDAALNAGVHAIDGVQKGIQAIDDTVGKVVGDKETRHYRREQKYLSKNPDSTYLIIQKGNIHKDIFSIYDSKERVKYYVQGKITKNNINLQLMDSQKQHIGSVKKTFLSLRAPVFHESKPADYSIEIGGMQVATLKTRLSVKSEDFEIEPYGWIIKGSILKWEFTVNDKDVEIVHISKRKGYDNPTYILDFPNKQHEIIGLLIVLTLICREN